MSDSLLDDVLATQVILDLFSRLPTATLAYSCRFASASWKRIVEIDMHLLWERRARTLSQLSPSIDLSSSRSPMQICIDVVRQAYKKWHVEKILRSWRKESRNLLAPHRSYWKRVETAPLNSDDDPRMSTLAHEMREQLDRVCAELDERILEDQNDAQIEAHLQTLSNVDEVYCDF